MKIYRLNTPKSELAKIPKEERTFFLLLGYLANELTVLNKLFYWCSQPTSPQKWQSHAHNTQGLVVARIIVGKLSEGWQLTQGAFFGTRLSLTYDAKLSPEAKTALDKLKSYFSKKNLIADVRNNFSFHYSVKDVQNAFDVVPASEEWKLYLSETHASSLYYTAEMVVSYALLEKIKPGHHREAMKKLMEETQIVVGWFLEFLNGCMTVVTESYLQNKDGKIHFETIDIGRVPSLSKVKIPYFVQEDRPKLGSRVGKKKQIVTGHPAGNI